MIAVINAVFTLDKSRYNVDVEELMFGYVCCTASFPWGRRLGGGALKKYINGPHLTAN
jgi:hypothetical protein